MTQPGAMPCKSLAPIMQLTGQAACTADDTGAARISAASHPWEVVPDVWEGRNLGRGVHALQPAAHRQVPGQARPVHALGIPWLQVLHNCDEQVMWQVLPAILHRKAVP